jgi:hypothetical protein
MIIDFLKKYNKPAIYFNAILFAGIYGLFFWFFKPALIFSTNIPTGGDMGSHYYTAWYTSNVLLPHFSMGGWDFGWFAGYAPFSFYFPLTFFLMGMLNFILPLPVAFKLVALSGAFLLPPAVFFLIKSFGLKKPLPEIGAVLSLIFLFNINMGSSAQIWGGTILSLLAGEFSQSLSLALGIFFLGFFNKSLEKEKMPIVPAIFLSATLLAHPTTFIWAVATSFGIIAWQFSWKKFWHYLKTMALTFIFSSFWLVPTLLDKKYFLNLAGDWPVQIADILPKDLLIWPIFLIGPIVFWKKEYSKFIFFLAFGIICAIALAFLALPLGTYPIRFLPYLQLFYILTGIFLGILFQNKKEKWLAYLAPVILFFAVGYYLASTKYETINSWTRWNFEGLETKTNFSDLKKANEYLKGGVNDSRVVMEYSGANNDTGTSRNNEMVPLLSGRSTLEGLYEASAISNPFIFKIQSEVSKEKTCQMNVIGFPCGDLDYDLGAEHLKMFNVGDLIVRSDEVKQILRSRNDFQLLATFGIFEDWKFLGSDNHYVSVPQFQPVVYVGKEEWKKVSFRWFNDKNLLDTPVIFNASKKDFPNGEIITDVNFGIKKIPIQKNCEVKEKLSFNEIKFTTSCVGAPHIIRVSFHPGWKAYGAEKIYLVSPSFMLVYPEKAEVVLKF